MKAYLDIVRKIFDEGHRKGNRTGIDTISIPGCMFEHDMAAGFPLLTTKKIAFRLVASELEFFIRGVTDKEWLRARNNHIWDEWCSPTKVPYGTDDETKANMAAERDLGPVYGWQWRRFGAQYVDFENEPDFPGVDQLKIAVGELKTNPESRRIIVSAWNPVDLKLMALPPCHHSFQLLVNEQKLSLLWNQRSVDTALGLPFNIASYGLLLHLLAKEAGLGEGKLIGFLGDTHIYVNHVDALKTQLSREPRPLPRIKTEQFTSIFDWHYEDSVVENYDPQPGIKFEIAV